MSSILEGKTCEIDRDLSSEVEGLGMILDSSSDDILSVSTEEACS